VHRLPRGVAVDRLQPIEELLCRHVHLPLTLRREIVPGVTSSRVQFDDRIDRRMTEAAVT